MSLAAKLDDLGRHEEALRWLRKAADNGHGPALHMLGTRLLVGRAAPFDPVEGAKLIQVAAQQGMPQSLAMMAVLASLSSDWTSAVDFLKQAASRGDLHARLQIELLGNPKHFDPSRWDAPLTPHRPFESPRIAVFERFIPPAFCGWIISRARPKLQPTRVRDPVQGGARYADYRSNSGAGFSLIDSDLMLQMVNARVAGAIGVPLANQEPTNVLHYRPGEEYRPHWDFITPSEKQAMELKSVGQRIITVLIYLNDDYEGGETHFTELGWSFKGKTGDALAFWNLTPEGEPDGQTRHAGLPPTRGEKWLYSKWVRARPYPLI